MNIEGCEWFIDEVLDRVRARLPDMKLRICGLVGLHISVRHRAHEGLEIAGRVDDLDTEYAAAGVVVNPVPYGTGLAIKAIEALTYAKPLICTSAGARGLRLPGTRAPCAIIDDPVEFATELVALLQDPVARAAHSCRAQTFVARWNAVHAANLDAVLQRATLTRER